MYAPTALPVERSNMTKCKTGRVIEKNKHDGKYFYIRLNLVDEKPDAKTKYRTKDIDTGLIVNRQNRIKAQAMIESEVAKHNKVGNNILFSEYCRDWLNSKKAKIATDTYEGYEYRMKHIIDYFDANKITLGGITPLNVSKFYDWLFTIPKTCTSQRGTGLSNRTVKDVARLLNQVLNDAVRVEYIARNPAKNILIPKREELLVDRSYIGAEDIDNFKNAIKGHRLEVPFLLTFYFGLRRSELAGLKWSAIRDNKLYIEYTVTKLKTQVSRKQTKTASSFRCYPLTDELIQLFNDIKERQAQYGLAGDGYNNPEGYIFTWEDGRPYAPDYITHAFMKLVRRSPLLDNSLTLHSLRASCVSVLIHDGVDVKDVQKWVGHKDVQTTLNIYARTNEAQQKRVSGLMSGLLL